MTKRRDRNRTARRRKRVYCFYWTHEEEHAVARIIAARILQTTTEKGETKCWNTTNAKSSTISP